MPQEMLRKWTKTGRLKKSFWWMDDDPKQNIEILTSFIDLN
jgi:hypothetical protein